MFQANPGSSPPSNKSTQFMHRLFVALRPPEAIRDRLLDVASAIPGARWQDEDQLHITLNFIGSVDGRLAEDIASALSTIHAPALDLRIAGVGCFGTRGRVSTLWAGVAPREPITALHHKVKAALTRAGAPVKHRAYLPHLTLARLSATREAVEPFLRDHAALASPAFTVREFGLFESHLSASGARYEQVMAVPLAQLR
jgi:2'-5' RNA ligase